MLSQIIFFVAVALLILLLARRIHWRGGLGALGRKFYGWLTIIGQFFSGFSRRVNDGLTPRRSKVHTTGVPVVASEQHQFWQEETPKEKTELSSNFEEGDRYFKEKKYAEAERFFLKAAANNPKDAKIYARLGLIYLEQKNYSDAIESLKVAAKLDSYNPSRHYNLALAYMGNSDAQKAIASVREAITLDPVTKKYRTLLEQLLNG